MIALLTCVAAASVLVAPQGRTAQEIEPNDSTATATVIALGDSIVGSIRAGADKDYYALQLNVGAHLDLQIAQSPNPLQSRLSVIAPDGVTVLADDWSSIAHIQLPITQTGRYFVLMQSGSGPGPYGIKVSSYVPLAPGPGEPARVIAAIEELTGIAAAPNGDVFAVTGRCCGALSDPRSQVLRIDRHGVVTPMLPALLRLTGDIAVLPSGDVLVTGLQWMPDAGRIWRIAANGAITLFASGVFEPKSIVLGPDGHLWVGAAWREDDAWVEKIIRFDTTGARKGSLALQDVREIAFSPTGMLYYTNWQGVHKLANGASALVWDSRDQCGVDGLAFDRDGYLYIGCSTWGLLQYGIGAKVVLLDPQDRAVHDPFALLNRQADEYGNRGTPIDLVFARDASGQVTSRLLTTATEGVVELNRSAVRAPGWDGHSEALEVDRSTLVAGTAGVPYSATLRLLNYSGPATWTAPGARLPPGLSLSSAGVLSGVPADSGSFVFDVWVADGPKIGSALLTVSINPGVWHIDQTPLDSGAVGFPYDDTLRVFEGDVAPRWQLVRGTVPPGLNLSLATGRITGVPRDSGTVTLTVRAWGAGRVGESDVTLRIAAPSVTLTSTLAALFSTSSLLPAGVAGFIDFHGNNNGVLDVGDLRAYLRVQGKLP